MEQQRIELTGKRQKPLDAHYAGAIPIDLLKTEQDRIASQLMRIQEGLAAADANYEQARATLADTLDLTRDCHAAYLEANDQTRRLFNQAFFAKIYIDEDDETRERTVRVDYNEPFDNLLSRLAPARVHHDLAQEETAHGADPVGGSSGDDPRIAEVEGSHTNTLVVLVRSFSNSTSTPLCRALRAYRKLDLSAPGRIRSARRHPRRAVHLNARQLERLAERYEAGGTVYELAAEFQIDRGTVSERLKYQGVIMRSQHRLTGQSLEGAIRLYSGGWSCKRIGDHLGFDQRTVWNALRQAGVALRQQNGWTYPDS